MNQQLVFNVLKTTITFVSILTSLDTTILFHIEADILDYTIEAVLSQELKIDSK